MSEDSERALRRALAAYDGAVRDPSSQRDLDDIVRQARADGAVEALVVALRAQAWCARYAMAPQEAKALLDEAVRIAGRHHLDDRLVQVLATRAAVNHELGRPDATRRDLRRARSVAGDRPSPDLDLQAAVLAHNEGRLREAAALYERLLAHDDTPLDIRVKVSNNLALIESHHGRHASALARLEAVQADAAAQGPALVAIVEDTRAWVTVQSGRLAEGLRLLDVAADRHVAAGLSLGEHYLEHSDALEDLRLLPEAIRLVTLARDEFRSHEVSLLHAEAEIRLSRLSGLTGEHLQAEEAAAEAGRLFTAHRRTSWAAFARVLEVQARMAQRATTAADAGLARRAARRLEKAGMVSWAADAHLVAAGAAVEEGRTTQALDSLADAQRLSHDGPALLRLKGHLAGARAARLTEARAELLGHARAGLVDLAEHQDALPSIELRALASGHGVELGQLALSELLSDGRPAEVLLAMERTRAASSLAVRAAPIEGREQLIGELRAVHEELDAVASGSGTETELLAAQRAVEGRIRRATWREQASGSATRALLSVAELRRVLAGRTLVEYAAVDGELIAVVLRARTSRLVRLGPVAAVDTEGEHLLFALRHLAQGSSRPVRARALWASATSAVNRLRELLVAPLGLAAGEPLVVVPSAVTWRLPWSHLCAAPVSVAPSSAAWVRSARRAAPVDGGVVLVAGPDLPGAESEIADLARLHPKAQVMAPPESTVEAAVAALDGARLAHLACHGRLRLDNPTFSSFRLSSGELSIHELDLHGLAPHRVVLSACDSGSDRTYAGDEFVGFVSALLAQGTAGLVASCVQVSDAEVVPVMVALHRRLLGGDSMAEAVYAATTAAVDTDRPEALAARAAFSAYGAA